MARASIGLQPVATLRIAAASGLLIADGELVVVADDELVLHRYALDGSWRGDLRLFAGELPEDHEARKAAKPDLEGLCLLPDGRWLAFGSGSKLAGRDRGVLVDRGRVIDVDLVPLYTELRAGFDRLNIEGAAVCGPHLVLLSRRTGRRGRNALVRLDLGETLRRLAEPSPSLDASLLVDIVDVDLGDAAGTPFGFTDATPHRGGLLCSAVAEATDDPVLDGACHGAMIGWLDGSGSLRASFEVSPLAKIEGLTVAADGRLFAVSDADDRRIAASLFVGTVPSLD